MDFVVVLNTYINLSWLKHISYFYANISINVYAFTIAQRFCTIRIGIEWNYIKGIAETSNNYINEYLDLLEAAKIEHVVLSWDAVHVPSEHIDAIGLRKGNNEIK